MNASPDPQHSKGVIWRWLAFMSATIALALILIGVPREFTSVVFGLALVAAFVIGAAWFVRSPANAKTRSEWRQSTSRTTLWIAHHRARLSQVFGIIALVLMAISALMFRPANLGQNVVAATWIALFGGLALGVALWLQPAARRQEMTYTVPTDAPTSAQPFVRRPVSLALGIIGIFIFSEMSGRILQIPLLAEVSLHIQFLLLVVSTVLIIRGFADAPVTRGWPGWTSADVLIVLGIVIVAFNLRIWGLDTTVRTLVDEVHFSSGVVETWLNPSIGMMQPMTRLSPFPWVYPYWQAQMSVIFGHTFTGLRAISAVLGTFNIVAIYLLIRALFDRKTALLAAFLLLAFPPHLHFSRLSIIQIADPLFATFGLAFLARGLRDNRRTDYALGGAGIAFSQYFYEAGRLLFPALALAWMGSMIALWLFRKKQLRVHLPGLMTALAVFVLLTIPVYYTLAAMHFPFAERLGTSGLNDSYWENVLTDSTESQFTWEDQLVRFKAPWLFYVSQPETGSVYYGGTEPMVMSVVVPFFLLGLFFVLWRLPLPGMLLVALWLLSTSLGNSLLVGSAVPSRYLVLYPIIPLFIALGIRYGLILIWPQGRWKPSYRGVVAGGLAVILAVLQVAYYFGPHLEAYQTQGRPVRDIQDAVLRSADFPACTQVHVIGSPVADGGYGNQMATYFGNYLSVDALLPEEVTDTYITGLTAGVDHAFYLEPADFATLSKLREYLTLDGPTLSPYPMPPRKQYVLYYAETKKNPDTIGSGTSPCAR